MDAAYPSVMRYENLAARSMVDASHVDAATALVGLSAFKTRIVLSDEEDDLDRYLRSLIAQAVQLLGDLTRWPLVRGSFTVRAVYEDVVDPRIYLPGPVDTAAAVAVVDDDGATIRAVSWDDAYIEPALGAPARIDVERGDGGRKVIVAYAQSWDPWIPAKSVDHPLAEIVYRTAATLFTYRESGDMGLPRARAVMKMSLGRL